MDVNATKWIYPRNQNQKKTWKTRLLPKKATSKVATNTPDKKKPAKAHGSKRKSPDAKPKQEEPTYRAGFMLGDGAGMGKGKLFYLLQWNISMT